MGAKFWAITRDTETVNMAASVRVGTASFHTGGKIVKIKQPSANTNSFILWENTYIFISCPYSQFLRSSLLHQPCEQFLATENRQLLFEGLVTLNGKMSTSFLWNYSVQPKILFTVKNYVFFPEITKSFDIYLFVFDDVMLLTKPKKIHRKVKEKKELQRVLFILYISSCVINKAIIWIF